MVIWTAPNFPNDLTKGYELDRSPIADTGELWRVMPSFPHKWQLVPENKGMIEWQTGAYHPLRVHRPPPRRFEGIKIFLQISAPYGSWKHKAKQIHHYRFIGFVLIQCSALKQTQSTCDPEKKIMRFSECIVDIS